MSELTNDLLPFDETASKTENYLLGRSYTISNVGQDNYQQLVLRQGAFYTKDFKIVHASTNTTLVEGVDYQFSYFCREIHDILDLFAFSAIILLNKNLYGTLLIDSRMVGGDYGAPKDSLIPNVIQKGMVDSTYLWEDVEGVPSTLPVTAHEVSTKLLTEGFEDMVEVLKDINQTIQDFGEVQPGITIDWVEGLQDALDAKFENQGLNQLNRLTAVLNYPGYLEITLPQVELLTKLMLSFEIATKDALYDIAVGGVVAGAANDSDAWASASAKVIGPRREIEIRTGYRVNKPTLIIGPFTDGEITDTIMLNLNHYMVDGMSASFTPEFDVKMIATKPAGWVGITNRFNSNDHDHPISAINGLPEKHSEIDGRLDATEEATSINASAISDTNTALNQHIQSNSSDHNTMTQAIEQNATGLGDLSTAFTEHVEAAETQWDKIAANELQVGKVTNFLKASEETFTIPSDSVLTIRGLELNKAKVYVVTLVGSQNEGDVYQGILRSINEVWTSVAVTLGAQQPTTPILVVEEGQVKVKCFDSSQSDTGIIASVRLLDPSIKLT